ncbi:3-oxoacyl-(acyl-carrier-protein) reductase [Sphaerochaeta pleomorpha str. Grapes]|uniref:3-oxoacyl-[acyl-carrier-protein] reductase n=1 Tax=Sphaerochaeta pleomorpha (strain ATCC BAA-1885 / DSM 22778 / Grapes) TaxID=158190 RepID=G8QV65_SPHPG|nr:3-oxoacyl-[acyl-carrier-protein] reductase [Sphaerochaeta pleomorpha]AEV29301.1 3-oxoacyl-(acyl-carrier-protein) reductase [Sphaerochaeta pleomorpha str. Grapes]
MENESKTRHAVVTGGSRGIGMAIVEALLKDGCDVWYLSRSEGETLAALTPLAQSLGKSLFWVACDMADRQGVETALDTVIKEAVTIDVLVNNAGITRDGLLMRMKDQAWDDVIAVNLTAAFLTCRKIGRLMAGQRSGSIINTSSVVGIMGNGGQTNYAASKAGLIGFSKSLARELSLRNIRVNVVAPGFIETAMTEVLSDNLKDTLKTQIPLGRIGSAGEIAEAVAFLASDRASYITGQVLAVDGGMAM